MIPPTNVLSTTVRNTDEQFPIQVTVHYKDMDGNEEIVEEWIEAGQEKFFGEKTRQESTWTSTKPIAKVTVKSGGPVNSVQVLEAPFKASGITQNYLFTVGHADNKLAVNHGH